MFIPRIKSIKNKIIAGILLVSTLTIVAGFAAVLISDIERIKSSVEDQASVVAQIIGESCVSAISFNYPDNAKKNLSLIASIPEFESAIIFNESGELFAYYGKIESTEKISLRNVESRIEYVGNHLHLVEPIVYEGKKYGTIYLKVRPDIEKALKPRIAVMFAVVAGLLILSYLLAGPVQRVISTPILQLAGTAQKISKENDYSLRLENVNSGEIGVLFDAFNSMLSAIQQRDIQRSTAESNLRFKEQVIEYTNSCIVTTDLKGLITYANPSFLKLFGYFSLDEMTNRSFSRCFISGEICDSMLSALQSHDAWSLETKARHKGGSCFDAVFSAGTILDSQKLPSGIIITVSDISELRMASRKMERENRLKSGQGLIYDRLRGEQDITQIADNILKGLKEHIDFHIGAVYVSDEEEKFNLAGSYALSRADKIRESFIPGEGIAGEAAYQQQRILVSNLPEEYLVISSGVGNAWPRYLIAIPFVYEGSVKGVLELGSFNEFSDMELELIDRIATSIAISLHTAQAREQVHRLLEKTQAQSEELQAQTEELQAQQGELKKVNTELEYQTKILLQSEKRLQRQQEELQQTNEELEEQRDDINRKNEELEKARELIERKANDLENASRYKSEFLANMSHELRTPLNSILLLSDVLMENRERSLSPKHVAFAENIHASGNELLNLINDILDLSKIESGKMSLIVEAIKPEDLAGGMERTFSPVARKRDITLEIEISPDLPKTIRTDRQKVDQILKNLLSNAFKFTEKGSVKLRISPPDEEIENRFPLIYSSALAVFSVSDTGIGISEEKQSAIFDAFTQVDGTTSRKYGGTGLGLSISRELATLLEGELIVSSKPGEGSTFFLVLHRNLQEKQEKKINARGRNFTEEEKKADGRPAGKKSAGPGSDFRDELGATSDEPSHPGVFNYTDTPSHDSAALSYNHAERPERETAASQKEKSSAENIRSILIVEDDIHFSSILQDLAIREGFQAIIAKDGRTGLHHAGHYAPSAILLDIGLPDMDGWSVLGALKNNPSTRHIPVHIISALDSNREAVKLGAIDFITKPVKAEQLEQMFRKIGKFISRPVRKLLVVEDDPRQMKAIMEIISNGDVRVTGVSSGAEAKEWLFKDKYDCLILDLSLPDMNGEELLTMIRNEASLSMLPVIIYTARDLSEREKNDLQRYAESIIIKGKDSSTDRLLDETTLFLHRVEATMSSSRREILRRIHDQSSTLRGKHILLVDDDIRNVFAVSSILEDKGMLITVGRDGKEAIEALDRDPSINLVLMDLMMPEMDGLEAIRIIRRDNRFRKLPVIALTAKAMDEDRYRSIEAGASDYLSKPVDGNKLLSMMRVWLY